MKKTTEKKTTPIIVEMTHPYFRTAADRRAFCKAMTYAAVAPVVLRK